MSQHWHFSVGPLLISHWRGRKSGGKVYFCINSSNAESWLKTSVSGCRAEFAVSFLFGISANICRWQVISNISRFLSCRSMLQMFAWSNWLFARWRFLSWFTVSCFDTSDLSDFSFHLRGKKLPKCRKTPTQYWCIERDDKEENFPILLRHMSTYHVCNLRLSANRTLKERKAFLHLHSSVPSHIVSSQLFRQSDEYASVLVA